jgi:hypothetical protein
MHKETEIVILQSPETSRFIAYEQSNTSQYITYLNDDSSIIPESFDQIIKNNIVIIMRDEDHFA